ncbi:S-adenosylmethionine uptake transporter [Duganella sp. CF402]|uniref:DMT family transporter n=1 Tax=unclassified Duganella TaxID=2636909 RepID=UPI0008D7CB76|nr:MULTISPECIES: DMT family transporter [unclassified Duganella]RZT03947.1 S-adenosylmethionine uptake transporter [Duganella sp. BK701]SEM53957.1 S-adenosylmethionine uptake transporter [Duganella sp. CF402]
MQSLWMLFASFMFAVMGVCVKLASAEFSTSELVLYRGVVGVIALGTIIKLSGETFRTSMPGAHLWRGIIGVISLWLWYYSIGQLPLATAMTLNYMSPIWIAVWLFAMGWWHAKNDIKWPLLLAVGMSFIGVTLLLRPAFHANQLTPALIALGSSVITATAYMQVRKMGLAGEPENRVVFYFTVMNLAAGIVGVLITGGSEGPQFHPITTWRSGLLLLAIGVCATSAQIAMTRAYRLGNTLVVANLQYTGIVFSSVWGVFIFGDVFDWHSWAGIGIILASGMAATFYNTRNTERGKAIASTDPIASEV